jgi:hypothetical protein
MAVPGVWRSGGACKRLSLLHREAVVLLSHCTIYTTAVRSLYARGVVRRVECVSGRSIYYLR